MGVAHTRVRKCLESAWKVEWTEITWNPTTGCDRISPGCDNCHATAMAKRLKAMGAPKYQNDGDPRTSGPGLGVFDAPGIGSGADSQMAAYLTDCSPGQYVRRLPRPSLSRVPGPDLYDDRAHAAAHLSSVDEAPEQDAGSVDRSPGAGCDAGRPAGYPKPRAQPPRLVNASAVRADCAVPVAAAECV